MNGPMNIKAAIKLAERNRGRITDGHQPAEEHDEESSFFPPERKRKRKIRTKFNKKEF
jgi:hypothetical protein